MNKKTQGVNARLPRVTAATQEAAIFAALATGTETHEAIAARMGCSRVHVSRVAGRMRGEIEAEASKTKQAAIDGPVLARQRAADAMPEAVDAIIDIMRKGDPEDAVRLAAAKTLCDRGGVPVRSEIDAAIATDPDRLIRLRAMLRAKGDDE